MESPLVSAIVLNYRSPQPTVECVLGLLEQSIAENMEVIVVDNHSTDDSIGVLRNRLGSFDRVRIVEASRNRGFGSGYNLGVHYARGRFILINNPDKNLQHDGIEKLTEKMKADPGIGIIAPKLLHHDGTCRHSARAFPRPLDVVVKRTFLQHLFPKRLIRYLQLHENPDLERDVDWVVGGNLMMRRELFHQLHGFDEGFFLFFEDIDLCRRCQVQGKRVVYYPKVHSFDRKKRLSEGGIWTLLSTPVGRAHIASGIRYFLKWGVKSS
jgi:GT2 family glycosyltransferase